MRTLPVPDALFAWLDSLRSDALFGLRRLGKSKLATTAAILSLALAIGGSTSAFRLIDALLLRPLPVAAPERLYALTREMAGFDGKPSTYDSWAYPAFRLMRAAVKDQRARSEFRVSNIRTQEELNRSHTIREGLLAMLSLFFAAVALILAGLGLYGALDYYVLQRRREIGIRMAIGAQPGVIARLVTADVFSMVLAGSFAGIALGLLAASLAALPSVIRAVCIDPLTTLRADSPSLCSARKSEFVRTCLHGVNTKIDMLV